jgi:hypothetical protein
MDLEKLKSEHERLETNRKFSAVVRVARSIRDFETRLKLHINQEDATVDWERIDSELTSGSEQVALSWMKAFWTGDLPPGSNALSMLWITDSKIKEAIGCALAENTFSTYVLEEWYRTVKAS